MDTQDRWGQFGGECINTVYSVQLSSLSPIQVLREYEDIVELNRVYTNSIHSMADTYGIEAAVTAIVRVSPCHACGHTGMQGNVGGVLWFRVQLYILCSNVYSHWCSVVIIM